MIQSILLLQMLVALVVESMFLNFSTIKTMKVSFHFTQGVHLGLSLIIARQQFYIFFKKKKSLLFFNFCSRLIMRLLSVFRFREKPQIQSSMSVRNYIWFVLFFLRFFQYFFKKFSNEGFIVHYNIPLKTFFVENKIFDPLKILKNLKKDGKAIS